jgi:vancomycin resistance protein VanJ
MMHRLNSIVLAASIIYSAALLGFLALQRTSAEGLWWVRLAADFLPYLFLPLLVLLPLAVLSGSRWAGVVVCVPCLAFLVLYGARFLPRWARASHHSGRTLTVMSYNVTMGFPGVGQILSIIESENPDVIGLQELSPQVAEALSRLDERYPYQSLYPQPVCCAGSGVLSRFPILHDEAFPLIEGGHLYQHLILDVEGRTLHLLNVHPKPPKVSWQWPGDSLLFIPTGYDATARDREIDRLIEQLDSLDGTVVVLGDFNMTDQSAGYKKLTRRLNDGYREAGWGLGHTFPDVDKVGSIPVPFPLVRIDYVFHSRDVTAVRATVGANGGPDHRFLVAELSF